MRKIIANQIKDGVRLYSTAISVAPPNVCPMRKTQYEDTLGLVVSDVKPAEWNEALPFDQLPGPKGLPFIGNSWRFMKHIGDWHGLDTLQIQERCFEKYGPISTLGPLYGRQTVFLCDVDGIEKLHRNEGIYPIRLDVPSFVRYRTKERAHLYSKNKMGLNVLQGKDWYEFRSKVNPIMMNIRSAQNYIGRIDEVADTLIDKMRYLMDGKEEGVMPDEFAKELAKYTLDNVTFIAVNKKTNCLDKNTSPDSEYIQLCDKVLEIFGLFHDLDILPPFWQKIQTPTWRRYVRLLDEVTGTVNQFINEALIEIKKSPKKASHEKSVIEMLVDIDLETANVMALDMILTGIDTTSKTLGTALYLLAKNPEKQALLREELKRLLPDKHSPVTKEVLNNAHYLKAVLKEVSRIAPVSIGNLRLTVKDMVICGYQIPKMTEIITVNYLLTRMEKHYHKAKEFLPERWLRTTTGELSYKNANPFAYLPFGHGPRSCIGKRFANMEMEIGLAKIVRNFEVSWPHKDATFTTMFLHCISDPLRFQLRTVTN